MSSIIPQPLKPQTIPLSGRHLIEASAGTGKTYNITRIYLRLLLERKLDVKNILVMTFTRAATEELRGRIAMELRNAIDDWGRSDTEDEFFKALYDRFDKQQVHPVLHHALLHLDEAAIFTIHGFCKRILSQQAFSSGVAFNVQMEANTIELELEAVRDWYRNLAYDAENYTLLSEQWKTPETFHLAFKDILASDAPVKTKSVSSIEDDFSQQKQFYIEQLQKHRNFIFEYLIDQHKDRLKRTEEWEKLQQWLLDNTTESMTEMPKSIAAFFSAGRFPKKVKQELVEIFTPLNELKNQAKNIEKQLQTALVYQLAYQGIQLIRKNIATAKQKLRVMNYDDLIYQLANSLHDEHVDRSIQQRLAQQIRDQYPVALVDEFQDTDPQQYAILNSIYQDNDTAAASEQNSCALYMIGDPKQAIYAFRSGDVFTYLDAREDAHYHWVMDTNWRSSTAMVNAYNRLFYGAPVTGSARDVFGFDIDYMPVRASGKADRSSLQDLQTSAALQMIHFPFNEAYQKKRTRKEEMTQEFSPVIARWCTSEIHRLLSEKIKMGEQALLEKDIAVLVRDKTEAAYIQDALLEAGYSSVYLSTHDNVFFSNEALELKRALYAILELENERALIEGMSSRFLGGDTGSLFQLQEDENAWETMREQVFELREVWLKRGFMAMALKLIHQQFTPEPRQHERSLTNTIQLLELLQQASQRHQQPEQLLSWFREQMEAPSAIEEAELRLESDANLIRIVTQHGSKGLEYPVVFIPYATRYKDPTRFGSKNIDLFKYHERSSRVLNYFIGQDEVIRELYRQEAYAESIRLLYVAITRAEHRCYVCATPFANYQHSPLGLTLHLDDSQTLDKVLSELASSEPDNMQCQTVHELEFPVLSRAESEEKTELGCAVFHGHIERNWWLSSFSALTRNLRHGGISTPDRDQDNLEEQDLTGSVSSNICFNLTKGAAAGNLLHDILEHTDFSHPDWQRSIQRPLSRFSEKLDMDQQKQLISWLQNCLDVKLDVGSDLRLGQLKWSQTLRETEFYFPMQQVSTKRLGQLLKKHRNQPESSFHLPAYHKLEGMMHGFIDLIFQWQGRFYVLDYKSTHLGDRFEDYNRSKLEQNIRDNYYDLQYLLYSLALHRYLKKSLPDYDVQQHFGGIYYLYLRGMKQGTLQGVYYTAIHPGLLLELDALFANVSGEVVEHVL